MAITNEARIKVVIDGKEAEVSVAELGNAMKGAFQKANSEGQKVQSSLRSIGQLAEKFFFTYNSLKIIGGGISRLMQLDKVNVVAVDNFRKAWEDVKNKIGEALRLAIIPMFEALTPLIQSIASLDSKTVALIGSVSIMGITLMRLIPILRTLGITSKAAMGWIGLVIIALEALYTAYQTNFLGIGDFIRKAGALYVAYWKITVNFVKSIGDLFNSLYEIIHGFFSRNWIELASGYTEMTKLISDNLVFALEEIYKTISNPDWGKAKEAGKKIGQAIGSGITEGLMMPGNTDVTGGVRGLPKMELIGKVEEVKDQFKIIWTAADEFNKKLMEMGDIGSLSFNIILESLNKISVGINQSLWGMKVKFKDIWKSIAMDFTQIFINKILSDIAQLLIPKILKLLAFFDKTQNDAMAVRVGGDYAKYFMRGVMGGLNPSALTSSLAYAGAGAFSDTNIVRQLAMSNKQLTMINNQLAGANGRSPVLNVTISEKEIYGAVNSQRAKEKIRLGEDINSRNFL
jgi:hypothetical protein